MQSPVHIAPSAKRLPRACAECSRRKTRCDRRRPCRPCLQRNQARQCLALSLENTNIEATKLELALLKERIAELEAGLLSSVLGHGSSELSQTKEDSVATQMSPPHSSQEHNTRQELEKLDAAIEELNLGAHVSANTPGRSFLSPRIASPQWRGYLPSRNTSVQVVTFALNELGWIHCALQASVFFQEHESFWTSIQNSDYSVLSHHPWLATYYAVLAVGVYYMDQTDKCFLDFGWLDPETPDRTPQSLEDCATLAKIWYRHALHELERSDFLGNPRLSSVQTIAILPLLNSSFGESEREWVMMGAAINVARSLQMHKLGKEGSQMRPVDKPEWSTREKRAVGRRLWWTFCVCDWLGNMSRPTSIAPGNANTELTLGIDDEDLMLGNPHVEGCPSSQMSLLDYHHTMTRLASILQTYVKDGHGTSVKNLQLAMRSVEETFTLCPSHLREGRSSIVPLSSPTKCHHQRWAGFQGYLLTHTVQFLRLTISRSFLNVWLQDRSEHNDFHRKAIDAAEAIVQKTNSDVPQMFRKSWIVCASTVAAGVMLSIDLLCFSKDVSESVLVQRRESVQHCIAALDSLQGHNAIAKGGPDVLRRLLALESTWDHSRPKNRDTLQSILDHVVQRNVSTDQKGVLHPAHPTVSGHEGATVNSSATMEGIAFTPDTFDGIFATAFNEIDMFENPFEFNDSGFYTDHWVP